MELNVNKWTNDPEYSNKAADINDSSDYFDCIEMRSTLKNLNVDNDPTIEHLRCKDLTDTFEENFKAKHVPKEKRKATENTVDINMENIQNKIDLRKEAVDKVGKDYKAIKKEFKIGGSCTKADVEKKKKMLKTAMEQLNKTRMNSEIIERLLYNSIIFYPSSYS